MYAGQIRRGLLDIFLLTFVITPVDSANLRGIEVPLEASFIGIFSTPPLRVIAVGGMINRSEKEEMTNSGNSPVQETR